MLAYLLFFILVILSYQFSRKSPLKKHFWWALCLKLGAGIVINLLFRRLYGTLADSEALFEAACMVANKCKEDPLRWGYFFLHSNQHDFWDYYSLLKDWSFQTVFSYKLVSILCLLAQNDFWLVNLYCSWLSFIGFWACANVFYQLHQRSLPVVVAFLCFPSMLAWSSGLLKESLLWFLMGSSIYLLHQLLTNFKVWQAPPPQIEPLSAIVLPHPQPLPTRRGVCKLLFTTPPPQVGRGWGWGKYYPLFFKQIAFLFIAFLVLFKLKYYYAVVLFAAVSMYVIGMYLHHYLRWSFSKIVVSCAVAFVGLLVLVSPFHQNLRLQYFFIGLVQNYHYLALHSDVESTTHYTFFTPDIWGVLRNIPQALFASFYSPLPTDTQGNPLKIAAAVENTVLLLAVLSIKIPFRLTTAQKILLLSVLLYCLSLAVLLALATPNIGTLLRIKVGFMPFVVYGIVLGNRWVKG